MLKILLVVAIVFIYTAYAAVVTCGPNEELNRCPSNCSDACPTRSGEFNNCRRPNREHCPPPKCVCQFNYRRAENGTCIPARDCPAFDCPNENEEYNPCPGYCPTDDCTKLRCRRNEVLVMNPTPCADRVCPRSLKALRQACVSPSNVKLPPKCVCRFNYSRDRRGRCIPTHSCPPIACGHNEIFDACPPQCPSDDCSQATPSGRCPIVGRIGIVTQCKPQCRCAYHHWLTPIKRVRQVFSAQGDMQSNISFAFEHLMGSEKETTEVTDF
ncbi:hypothetical protein RR48_14880 [Papilio machaon]|uniref:Uncharacterized protein n=1 Tax=Papilio machaon TaxID=76193 RepID=A0A194R5U8_PAPMA|nr:hypothetical protein RR48_14880 [Papilio machaon]